jgi:hypothetical protein
MLDHCGHRVTAVGGDSRPQLRHEDEMETRQFSVAICHPWMMWRMISVAVRRGGWVREADSMVATTTQSDARMAEPQSKKCVGRLRLCEEITLEKSYVAIGLQMQLTTLLYK